MFRNSSKNGTNNDLGDIEFRQPLLTGSEGQGNSHTLFDADDSDEEQRPWYEGWGGPAPPVAFGMGVFGGGLPIPHRTPTPPPGYRAGSLTWMTEDPRTLLVYFILSSFQ